MTRKHRSRIKKAGLTAAFFGLVLFLANTSLWTTPPFAKPLLLAHRALGQDYEREGLTGETCTAERMIPSGHDYLENTIPSIQKAFELGADIVEFDVHMTTDRRFAVFHDWTLDCRTDGSGVTREHSLEDLQRLDVGYGYTADGGQTFPYRGQGVGLMPSMEEILTAFPDRDFLIDFKSNDPEEGHLLAERVAALAPARTGRIMVYGGALPVQAFLAHHPNTLSITRPRLKRCLTRYVAMGWSGRIPEACRNGLVMVPTNVAPWLWGWPHRFARRLQDHGSIALLIGDYGGEGFSTPFDDPARLDELPDDYGAGIWTDRIDLMGPAVRARR